MASILVQNAIAQQAAQPLPTVASTPEPDDPAIEDKVPDLVTAHRKPIYARGR
jgi:hypothetical protein